MAWWTKAIEIGYSIFSTWRANKEKKDAEKTREKTEEKGEAKGANGS